MGKNYTYKKNYLESMTCPENKKDKYYLDPVVNRGDNQLP